LLNKLLVILMGVGSGYMYDAENLEILWYDVVVKRSRSLSDEHL